MAASAQRERIYTVVAQIPPGRVTTYGRVARLADAPTPRMVGSAMRHLPEDSTLPWHRVIAASRRLADHGGAERQRERLLAEGISFTAAGKVPESRLWP
ncbi:MGMT family protein [Vreelandella jeotgali]|uniref:MGMT family protein n=1 Tax=Vreelandella jeotgali TaxID=553386 RepID=UPI00034C1311|nr:MGMT family protein [Halomonas jeotgali]